MTLDALLGSLRSDHRLRLRWRVTRMFGILPGSKEARRLSDLDCLLCGLHFLLDMGEPERGGDAEQNPAFDPEKFETLRGAQ